MNDGLINKEEYNSYIHKEFDLVNSKIKKLSNELTYEIRNKFFLFKRNKYKNISHEDLCSLLLESAVKETQGKCAPRLKINGVDCISLCYEIIIRQRLLDEGYKLKYAIDEYMDIDECNQAIISKYHKEKNELC